MSEGAQPIIELRDVDKAFGPNVVYKGMSLAIYPGETFAVIGGSGEGKSVCLKMMIGLMYADGGEVFFKGDEVGMMDAEGLRRVRQRVAMVFQGGALFDSMSVLDNVGYALREHTDMSDTQIRDRALECLDMVGMQPDTLELMPASLSGGMKKRVALARSIAIKPEVILYDEPTTGLDPINITRIGEMIMKLQRELRVTSVVVTHDMPTAFSVSDRIAVLHEKAFPFVGTPAEIREIEVREVRDFIQGAIA
jgi:phospholipid/cholesterol/gamma-HCH transport system ATP-binding protein